MHPVRSSTCTIAVLVALPALPAPSRPMMMTENSSMTSVSGPAGQGVDAVPG
jgi:hypothetical protein